MIPGAIIGLVVGLTIMLMHRRNARRGTGVAGDVERALRERGRQTVRQVAQTLGKDTFLGRGQVAQALAALSSTGKVRVHPAPTGTPTLKKIDVITYEAIG
ncbi:MAG: hypothetical protein IPL61_13595 [Myxococcales bacterium]|nr:hypothetical protein [Myxococcales bacterium]